MYDFEPDNTPSATFRRMLILLLAALVMALGIAAQADSVRLYDQVGVEGSQVTIEQVAELDGPAARACAGVVLATLGEGRSETTITLSDVEKALDQAGVNWGLVSLRGFNSCKVTRLAEPPVPAIEQGQEVTANIETPIGLGTMLTLRAMVEQQIAERAGVSFDELNITFSERDAKLLDIPILGRSVEIEPAAANTLGRVPVIVRLYQAQSVAETIRVSANVQRTMLAVVTTGPVGRGEVFTRDKLQVRECMLDDDGVTPITDPSIIIGQESTTSLRAGDLVIERTVRAPIMVKRGELVDVRCFVGGLIVRTVGHAIEDGSMDDRILVRSESTGDTFYAVVSGKHEVIVRTGADKEPESSTAMLDTQDQAGLEVAN